MTELSMRVQAILDVRQTNWHFLPLKTLVSHYLTCKQLNLRRKTSRLRTLYSGPDHPFYPDFELLAPGRRFRELEANSRWKTHFQPKPSHNLTWIWKAKQLWCVIVVLPPVDLHGLMFVFVVFVKYLIADPCFYPSANQIFLRGQ